MPRGSKDASRRIVPNLEGFFLAKNSRRDPQVWGKGEGAGPGPYPHGVGLVFARHPFYGIAFRVLVPCDPV